MASIHGLGEMTFGELHDEISRGGKFVAYDYCISALILSFRRSSGIYYFHPGENSVVKGLPWVALTFVFGWWGLPWGLIWTPIALVHNLAGGRDVTARVLQSLTPDVPADTPES